VRWRRSDRIPDEARAALELRPGERLLAAARTRDDRWFAATQRALVGDGRRLDWADIAHAQWSDEEDLLSVQPVDPRVTPLRLGLAEPGRLPETIRERVTASILLTRRVAVPGGTVNLVARDRGDREVNWQEVADGDVDLSAPEVRDVLEAHRSHLAGELGR
jgi:hypothetical protein